MKNMFDSFDPLTEAQLAEFETTIGHKLPEDYRRFLQQHNGGQLNPCDFKVLDPETSEHIDGVRWFFGITEQVKDRSLLNRVNHFGAYVAQGLLPIAETGMYNCIFISLSGDTTGRIYYWDRNVHPLGKEDLFPVADSLSQFFDSLFEQSIWED